MVESSGPAHEQPRYLAKTAFDRLFAVLAERGYQVLGPTIDQEAIVYAPIRSVADLPRGWTDEQAPGKYRIVRRDDEKWFGFVVGPHSWKRYLFPPLATLSEANKTSDGWQFKSVDDAPPKQAFLGVRACEIAAMQVQDRVFLNGPYVDPLYERRRTQSLVIAVNCTQAAPTCFCTSMNTGPECQSGYDIALTELADGFLVETGTPEGAAIIAALETRPAEADDLQAAGSARQQAVEQIQRRLNTDGIRDLLLGNLDHPRWDDVASRCLSCSNCTMVCPTCFCASVEDVADLSGEHVERQRKWDSCFNIDFSSMNGGVVRDQVRSRYRQWLTHKLASWLDQFGTSGCVGCGRCITWCPVGIDLTEEVAAIRGEAT